MYRTNAQSRALEEAFLRYGLRYQLVGGVRFYQRREVKDALAWLRALRNDRDAAAFDEVLECADVVPTLVRHATSWAFSSGVAGRIWPRSSTNTTLRSASSEFTKVRNLLSVAGSSMAAFHSQA